MTNAEKKELLARRHAAALALHALELHLVDGEYSLQSPGDVFALRRQLHTATEALAHLQRVQRPTPA